MKNFISRLGQAFQGLQKRGDGDQEIGAAEAVEAVSSVGTSSKVADWVMALAILCYSYAFPLAVMYSHLDSKIYPPLFHLLSLALLLAFFSLVAAELLKSKFQRFSHFLHHLALVLVAFSFYLAIAIPFPLYFKLISLFLFIISLSLFLFCSIKKQSLSSNLVINK